MGTDPNDLGLKKSYTKKIGKQNVDDYAKQGYNHLLDQFFSKQEEFDDKLKMANEEIIEIKETQHDIKTMLEEVKTLMIEQRENPLFARPPVLEDPEPPKEEPPADEVAQTEKGNQTSEKVETPKK